MPVCAFCGSTSAHGTKRCSVCSQPFLDTDAGRSTAPEAPAAAQQPAQPAIQPPPPMPTFGSGQQPLPGGFAPEPDSNDPPPGWGTSGSSTFGNSYVSTRRGVGRPGSNKTLKQRGPGKKAAGLISSVRFIVILVIVAGAIFLGARYQLSGQTVHVAIATASDEDFRPSFEILDADGKVLAKKDAVGPGDKCPWGRLIEFGIHTPRKPTYVFSVNGVRTNPVDSKEMASKDNAVTITYGSTTLVASTERPKNCL